MTKKTKKIIPMEVKNKLIRMSNVKVVVTKAGQLEGQKQVADLQSITLASLVHFAV